MKTIFAHSRFISCALIMGFIGSTISLFNLEFRPNIKIVVYNQGAPYHKFIALTSLHEDGPVSSTIWSSDGKYLEVGLWNEGIVNVYETKNWRLLNHIERWDSGGSYSSVRFVDDNKAIVLPRIWGKNSPVIAPSIDDNVSLERWNISDNSITKKYQVYFPGQNSWSFNRIRGGSIAQATAVSGNGMFVAAAEVGDPGVVVYNQDSGQVLGRIKCADYSGTDSIALSQDGHTLVTNGCTFKNQNDFFDIIAYDVITGQIVFKTAMIENSLHGVISFNQTGSLIAISASDFDMHARVLVLDAKDGSIKATSPEENRDITNVQWIGPDLILISYEAYNDNINKASIWSLKLNSIVEDFRGGHLQLISISPGQNLAAASLGDEVIIGLVK